MGARGVPRDQRYRRIYLISSDSARTWQGCVGSLASGMVLNNYGRGLMTEDVNWLAPGAFVGRKGIVTGGANGIGEAVADLIVTHGGKVAVLDREKGNASDDNRRFYTVDVTQAEDVGKAVADAASWMGGIDY